MRRHLSFPSVLSLALIATVALVDATGAEPEPVQVYILAGQSNMDGYGGLDAMAWQAENGDPDRREVFARVRKGGGWTVRDDVWAVYGDRKGPLTAGFGVGKTFMGVEWDFGRVVGDHHDARVLLIKCSWGGASIRRKFRPPSSGEPKDLIDEEYAGRLRQYEKQLEKDPNAKKPAREEVAEVFGQNYRRMVADVRRTLGDIGSVIPGYAGEGYEIAGFVWFQGFNDQFGGAHEEYATHLANLIRDVRKEFGRPDLPVVVGQMGHGGTAAEREERGLKPIGEPTQAIKKAQAEVCGRAEFRSTVTCVPTDVFWDWKAQAVFDKGWRQHVEEWSRIGAHYPYHYLGSPYTFLEAGRAFGETMVKLHGSR